MSVPPAAAAIPTTDSPAGPASSTHADAAVIPAEPGAAVVARRSPIRLWSVAAPALVGIGCVAGAIVLYRHGIAAHPFPSWVDGEADYQVERYSGPWVVGAMGLGGLGVVLFVLAVVTGWRGWRDWSAARRRSAAPAAEWTWQLKADAPTGAGSPVGSRER